MMFACVSDARMRTSFSTWFRYIGVGLYRAGGGHRVKFCQANIG